MSLSNLEAGSSPLSCCALCAVLHDARVADQVEEEDEEFEEEFVGTVAPSILHFLLASGDRISSKQARCFACCRLIPE